MRFNPKQIDNDLVKAQLSNIIKSQITETLYKKHFEIKDLKNILNITNKSSKVMEA